MKAKPLRKRAKLRPASYVDYTLTEVVATKEGETPANPNTIVFRGTEAEGKKSIVCTDVFVNGYELQCKALGDEVEFQFVKGEEVLTEGEAFTALKTAYDGFMKYMGFTIGNFELNDTLFLGQGCRFCCYQHRNRWRTRRRRQAATNRRCRFHHGLCDAGSWRCSRWLRNLQEEEVINP